MKVVRIIARLNVGGPSIQAITLTGCLADHGYATVLVRGREEPGEGSMEYLADRLDVRPRLIRHLRRNPGWHDVPALIALVRLIRRERPRIVHTHAAKAGTLGRVATVIASIGRHPKPVLIHTYHGHSLTGYFAPRTAELYRRIERGLARHTDRLIAVSPQVRDDLVALRVAPAPKFEVVPLGFDLSAFAVPEAEHRRMRESLRAEVGLPPESWVVTLVARLVPIKRVDRFLRVARLLESLDGVRFLIVGDGELRNSLQASDDAQALGDKVVWAGFRRDMPAVCHASDVVVLTSDNEGTPVSLIEAQTAAVPVVSTDVGGASAVVGHAQTGFLVAPHDEMAFARALRSLWEDRERGRELGLAGRERCLERFGLSRLVADILRLYRTEAADPA